MPRKMRICKNQKIHLVRIVSLSALLIFFLPFFLSNIQHPTSNIQSCWPHFFSEAMDFSDLDVRDSQNRPVTSQTAKEQLAQLFSFSVVNLLVSEALPVLVSFRRALEKLLAPLSERFSQAKKWLREKVFWALAVTIKKFSDLFALYPLPYTLLWGDSNLRGVSRLSSSLFTLHSSLQLSLPLLC